MVERGSNFAQGDAAASSGDFGIIKNKHSNVAPLRYLHPMI